MKSLFFGAALLLSGAILSAEQQVNWSLLTGGSWEESKTLYNRGEIKINFLPSGLTFRGEVLDRRPLNFELDSPWGDSEKHITNFLGGLYHKSTGSRFLYGVIDEWGLPARIRNPWIRSAPYAENHKPIMADLKTSASSTKNDEAYLYLSSPYLNIFQDVKMRGFISAQTETEDFNPAFSGGIDFNLPNKTVITLETFYLWKTLPPTKNSSWFTYPPPLPEREFKLYAAGFLFHNQLISVSSDWAFSETFAWGTDVYGNFGINLTPLLSFGNRKRPLSISFSMDGAGEKFIYRDGANHGEGFRSAAKIEWKGRRNSLFRFKTVLYGHELYEDFSRSSTSFYYRFPANRNRDGGSFPLRLTRISLTATRNADNPLEISDKLSGYMGFSLNLNKIAIKTPLGINVSGSLTGLTSSSDDFSPYPFFDETRVLDTAGINCEFTWPLSNFTFKTKTGYTKDDKNGEKWIFSFSTAVRFGHGRLSVKTASADFPENWKWTVSWRLETKNIKIPTGILPFEND